MNCYFFYSWFEVCKAIVDVVCMNTIQYDAISCPCTYLGHVRFDEARAYSVDTDTTSTKFLPNDDDEMGG